MNPAARANEIVSVAESLVAVMTAEVEGLKRGEVAAIAPLQERKAALADLYLGHAREVGREPGIFAAVDPALRERLAEAVVRFEAAAKENESAVRAALELNSRLMKKIVEAAREQSPQANGYTRTGATPGGYGRKIGPAAPVSLDHEF